MRPRLTLILSFLIAALGFYILLAPVPAHRAQRLVFGTLLPPLQNVFALERLNPQDSLLHGFAFEDPKNLASFRKVHKLDEIVEGAKNDFEAQVALMHWVRDRFPHAEPYKKFNPQAFDGEAFLNDSEMKGAFCGEASQLLVQAITALGGFARRVELRFTPKDTHAVVEAWSAHFHKWYVLDPDYDVYYSINGAPTSAIELHQLWAVNAVKTPKANFRDSAHNIYRAEHASLDPALIRSVYMNKEWKKWDKEIARDDPAYHQNARFAVKLLNYYTHVSYPLRNDWKSRPLPWWHPEGNHSQNSLVIQTESLRDDEDFLLKIPSPGSYYVPPTVKN